MSKTAKSIIAVIILLVFVAAAIFACKYFSPKANEGGKTITVEVVHGDESKKTFTISTDAEFLRGALEQEKLVEGSESEFGLFVTKVDGETADDSLQQWWRFSKDGVDLMTGVDEAPIADGEHYEITLTTGW